MKQYRKFLLHQVTRFGALTMPQMSTICEDICKRTALYHTVSLYKAEGLLYRSLQNHESSYVYVPTEAAYKTIFNEDYERARAVRAYDFFHTCSVAKAILKLSRYRLVSGIATEFEYESKDLIPFCYERTPDGIIQITRDGINYELALEVESSPRNVDRMKDLFIKYRKTLSAEMLCQGLIIVCTAQSFLKQYLELAKSIPANIKDRVIITDFDGLEDLKPQYFGERTQRPYSVLERTRTISASGIYYFPKYYDDLSKNRPTQSDPLGGGRQTTNERILA